MCEMFSWVRRLEFTAVLFQPLEWKRHETIERRIVWQA